MGCTCAAITPSQAFDQAQVVFTGRILKSKKSEWVVSVERVWKGELEPEIILRDVHARSSSAADFKKGTSYLFLVDVEKRGVRMNYSPRVCSWRTRLKSTKVNLEEQGPYRWVEDWVLMGRGEGTVPAKRID